MGVPKEEGTGRVYVRLWWSTYASWGNNPRHSTSFKFGKHLKFFFRKV